MTKSQQFFSAFASNTLTGLDQAMLLEIQGISLLKCLLWSLKPPFSKRKMTVQEREALRSLPVTFLLVVFFIAKLAR